MICDDICSRYVLDNYVKIVIAVEYSTVVK